MFTSVEQLFDALWEDYVRTGPHAAVIRELLGGASVPNDHVAFRGLRRPGLGVEALAAPFVELGYRPADTYEFEQKKLFARHYEPHDARHPKVFISELLVDQLSEPAQAILTRLTEDGRSKLPADRPLCLAGRPWTVRSDDYDRLIEESEYAAWMAAFGFRVNHFTVAVHALPSFDDLASVNRVIEEAGHRLNPSGGTIKGSPGVGLEQSSTLAGPVEVDFADGPRVVPGVYYEFALRHSIDGVRYEGFVTRSADRIFESTDARDRPA